MSRCDLVIRGAFVSVISLVFLQALPIGAQNRSQAKRVARPSFDDKEVRKIFFENLFDGRILVGDRPSDLSAAAARPDKIKPTDGTSTGTATGWAAIVSGSTIEDEVKRARQALDESVNTPTEFAGRGYKSAQVQFTTLALLFGIASEYDGDVRWKSDAASARDAFARAAANAKAGGNSQVFSEAKSRKQDLQELINGSGFPAKGTAEPKTNWGQTCNRIPLMQRLEATQENRMREWVADKAAFKANKEVLLHEAQLVAAIGEVLGKEGMEDADAEEYKAFCLKLKKAALEVADAVKLDSDEAARKAVANINTTCDQCHEYSGR